MIQTNLIRRSFLIEKVKSTVPCSYVMEDLNREELAGMFYEIDFKRQIKQSLESKRR